MRIEMKLADYITPESVLFDLEVSSKAEALQLTSASVSKLIGVPAEIILNALQSGKSWDLPE